MMLCEGVTEWFEKEQHIEIDGDQAQYGQI